MFGFQKLDVYRRAVTFPGVASVLAERVPRGHSTLADQLRRAALSVPLDIAEGSGKGTMKDREARRFYAIARGSALECEGPALMRLPSGGFRIYMDGYVTNEYYYSDSPDLATWSTKAELPNRLSGLIRHGTVLRE